MSDIIVLDNFSTLGAQGQLLEDSEWTRYRYTVVGKGMLARTGITDSRFALTVPVPAPTTPVPAHALLTKLPEEFTRFTTGFLLRSFLSSTRGSAQFAVVSLQDPDVLQTLLLIEVVSRTRIDVHYVDADGLPKTQTGTFPDMGSSAYIDYAFTKASNAVGHMTNFTLSLNNSPLLSGDFFNNAGTDLGIVHLGFLSTTPNPQGGFFNRLDKNLQTLVPASGTFNITDMYVAQNGRRYGKPVVSRTQATGVVYVTGVGGQDLTVINSTVPSYDRYVYGNRIKAAFTDHVDASASQVTTLIQYNVPGEQHDVTIEYGDTKKLITLTDAVQQIRVAVDGAYKVSDLLMEPLP